MTIHNTIISPRVNVRKVKKNPNQKILKPLTDPDFNYTSVKKKIDQKLENQSNFESLATFLNEREYHEIKVILI
jgi:hypothetical protein